MSVRYTSLAGHVSVRYMVGGKWSPLFWVAVVLLGMVIPLTAVINSFLSVLATGRAGFLYAAIGSGLGGDLALRYLILRGGL